MSVRIKRGWGFGRVPIGGAHAVELRAGLIPDAWLELIENDFDLRGLTSTLSERANFFENADLGAMIGYDGWNDRVRLRVQVTNGEGRGATETNNGKNTTAALTVTPLAIRVHRGPLRISLHGAFRSGTLGPTGVRNDRITAGLTFVGPCPRAGFEFVRANGYDGGDDRVAQGMAVWANSYFATHWIGGAVRYESIVTDVDANEASARRTTVALYSDILGAVTSEQVTRPPLALGFNQLRVYAAVQLDRFDENAGPIPGSPLAQDATRYMLMLQANGYRAWR